MSLLFVLPINLLLGCIIGFYFLNNRRRRTMTDVKIGLIVFMFVNIMILWALPQLTIYTWGYLLLSWFILSLGILSGEWLRTHIQDRVKHKMLKKHDVQIDIDSLVYTATKIAYDKASVEDDEMQRKLAIVKAHTERIKKHALKIDDDELYEYAVFIDESCTSLTRICLKVQCGEEYLKEKWAHVVAELSDISWNTLNEADLKIERQLKGPWATISLAIKTNQQR